MCSLQLCLFHTRSSLQSQRGFNTAPNQGVVNSSIIIFCKILLQIFQLFAIKNAENDYFDQGLECAAPKRWSKYTTVCSLYICSRMCLFSLFPCLYVLLSLSSCLYHYQSFSLSLSVYITLSLSLSLSLSRRCPETYFSTLQLLQINRVHYLKKWAEKNLSNTPRKAWSL